MAEPIVSVVLRRTNVHTRWPCLFCGGSSDKEAVNADVFSAVVNVRPAQTESAWTGYVVCSECLKRKRDELVGTIRENAAWHRERAEELETIATNLPALPTAEEWQKANRAADAEYEIDCHDSGSGTIQ